jgi:hypothetical protein
VVVGALTWLARGRALRPVEAIRAEFAEITAHDLHRRVPDRRAGDEVSRLAAIARDIAHAHGGELTAEEPQAGSPGARFVLTLPDPQPAPAPPSSLPYDQTAAGEREATRWGGRPP